ncbi:hypothetical protein [Pedobacter glucosidilyticus]|uniref:hypothetical protein n=1 Tax=Pedobacter glucosidilyticus TaxID=1122941 RepID=UPI0026EC7B12|nr:hypothetical protein [Pedobacter glucosidilyticus]
MKIKIGKDLYVNSNTLIRIEWRKWYPALVIHEKFERIVKWILRTIAFVGIATSVISISEWYLSLGFSILIFLIEQFFERTVIEYTVMVFQPPPDFEVEYGQWKTNGFMIPKEKNGVELAHFGPSYLSEEYAQKFFDYLREWVNDSSNDDKENCLVVSLVIEPNEKYTTYFYANLGRKRLDYMFKAFEDASKLEKYGKRQQNFIAQLFYWHTLDFKDGYFIKQFLDFQKSNDPFFFTPSVIQPFGLPPKFLFDSSIKKYHLKVSQRKDIKNNEPEFNFDPAKWKEKKTDDEVIEVSVKEPRDIFDDIQDSFSTSIDVGFMPNHDNSVGAINLCFDGDCVVPYEAYKNLIEQAKGKEVFVTIINNQDTIDLHIKIETVDKEIILPKLNYNKSELEKFIAVNGGGEKIVLLVGYPPANEKKIILGKGMSPQIVGWKIAGQ